MPSRKAWNTKNCVQAQTAVQKYCGSPQVSFSQNQYLESMYIINLQAWHGYSHCWKLNESWLYILLRKDMPQLRAWHQLGLPRRVISKLDWDIHGTDSMLMPAGMNGESEIRMVNLTDGKLVRKKKLSPQDFGEGLVRTRDRCLPFLLISLLSLYDCSPLGHAQGL